MVRRTGEAERVAPPINIVLNLVPGARAPSPHGQRGLIQPEREHHVARCDRDELLAVDGIGQRR